MKNSSSDSVSGLHRLSWVALMAALIALGAFTYMPLGPVPITFQDMFAALAGLALGPRYGVLAVALYVLAGVVGLPVFSGGRSGLAHLAGPTGGYLAGFVLLAFCAGLGARLAARRAPGASVRAGLSPLQLFLALAGCLAGLVGLYLCGLLWFMHSMQVSLAEGAAVAVLPFLPFGLAKALLAVLLWRAFRRRGLLPV